VFQKFGDLVFYVSGDDDVDKPICMERQAILFCFYNLLRLVEILLDSIIQVLSETMDGKVNELSLLNIENYG
jgi:hypothetical protein